MDMSQGDSRKPEPLSLDASLHPLQRIASQLHLLKQLPRTGWGIRGVHQVESVAAHSLGVNVWCLWLAARHEQQTSESVDRGRLLSLATLHDLAEASMGDLVPQQKQILFGADPVQQKEGIRLAEERFWRALYDAKDTDALSHFTQTLVGEWMELWEEYRSAITLEARLVKQADALDCVMQAIVYQRTEGVSLDVFARLFEKAAPHDPELQEWLRQQWEASSSAGRAGSPG